MLVDRRVVEEGNRIVFDPIPLGGATPLREVVCSLYQAFVVTKNGDDLVFIPVRASDNMFQCLLHTETARNVHIRIVMITGATEFQRKELHPQNEETPKTEDRVVGATDPTTICT